MQAAIYIDTRPGISAPAMGLAAGAAITTILLLAGLHILSPEFDPSWRVVSEYANGGYGWVLSMMFLAWALSSGALAFGLWPQVETRTGRIGLYFLAASGAGEAMASVFDINSHPMHDLAGALGIPTMVVAALLISASLCRLQPWCAGKTAVRWTCHLIWISLVLFIAAMVILVVTFHRAGGHMSAHLNQLPYGVIAFDGWANRLYVVTCCVWVITVAGLALPRPQRRPTMRAV